MDHAADLREGLVQDKVRGGVGGGPQRALHDVPFEVHDDHVLGFHIVIRDAAGLDHHQAGLPVDGAHVTPGEEHEAVLHEVQVRLADFLFEFF